MILFRALAVGLVGLVLTGCGGFLGEVARPLDAYELRAPTDMPQAGRTLGRSLVIDMPETTGGLGTDRIMIRPTPLEALYLPRARWTDETQVMLRALMLRSFEDTNALRHVGRRALPGGFSDFTLVSDLTDFQAELRPDDDSVITRVRMTARLVRDEDGAVLASRTFQTTAPAEDDETLSIVTALNSATQEMLREMVPWALGRMGVQVGS